jgi:hypothetical protein
MEHKQVFQKLCVVMIIRRETRKSATILEREAKHVGVRK